MHAASIRWSAIYNRFHATKVFDVKAGLLIAHPGDPFISERKVCIRKEWRFPPIYLGKLSLSKAEKWCLINPDPTHTSRIMAVSPSSSPWFLRIHHEGGIALDRALIAGVRRRMTHQGFTGRNSCLICPPDRPPPPLRPFLFFPMWEGHIVCYLSGMKYLSGFSEGKKNLTLMINLHTRKIVRDSRLLHWILQKSVLFHLYSSFGALT